MSSEIFADLKILDFTWAAAGPIMTKQFADNGARVIKVESAVHPDSVRLGGPFAGDKPGLNRSGFFADFNSSKQSISVDAGHPEALKVLRPLIEWADVVADSFRPGVMERWGMGYSDLAQINPSIITLSSSLYGAGGPWSMHPGYGAQGQALAGIHFLTGWPDRAPAAPKGAYSDSVSPRYATAALTAALIHRMKTGEGQEIELSQIEATLNLLTPQMLAYQRNGTVATRDGNRVEGAEVHGVFPTSGDDQWIAIEIWNAQELPSLVAVLEPQESPIDLPDGFEAREQWIASRTAQWDPWDLIEHLRAKGIAVAKVVKGTELTVQPELVAREHFRYLDHPEMGRVGYNGPAYRFEKAPSELTSAAPCLGADTDSVLCEIAGFDTDQIARFRDLGVLR